MGPLTNRNAGLFGSDRDLPRPFSKIAFAVMHDGAVVVRNAKRVDGVTTVLFKVKLVV